MIQSRSWHLERIKFFFEFPQSNFLLHLTIDKFKQKKKSTYRRAEQIVRENIKQQIRLDLWIVIRTRKCVNVSDSGFVVFSQRRITKSERAKKINNMHKC